MDRKLSIVISGAAGSGKSSLAAALVSLLRSDMPEVKVEYQDEDLTEANMSELVQKFWKQPEKPTLVITTKQLPRPVKNNVVKMENVK